MVILPCCLHAPGDAASSALLSERKPLKITWRRKEVHIAIAPVLDLTSAGDESFFSRSISLMKHNADVWDGALSLCFSLLTALNELSFQDYGCLGVMLSAVSSNMYQQNPST